jgi:hypothetical protein
LLLERGLGDQRANTSVFERIVPDLHLLFENAQTLPGRHQTALKILQTTFV